MKYKRMENKVYDCEQVINDYTQLKKRHLDWLYTFASMFETHFDNDEDSCSQEDRTNYRECIRLMSEITGKRNYNTYIAILDEIENELPFDADFKRDIKQDR